jgi:hypothetical protein
MMTIPVTDDANHLLYVLILTFNVDADNFHETITQKTLPLVNNYLDKFLSFSKIWEQPSAINWEYAWKVCSGLLGSTLMTVQIKNKEFGLVLDYHIQRLISLLLISPWLDPFIHFLLSGS